MPSRSDVRVTALVDREVHERDHEGPAEEQQEETQECEAEDVVAVGELAVGLDGRDRDVGRTSLGDGFRHRTTGSTAIMAKSSAR
jgi:hypothetical protein